MVGARIEFFDARKTRSNRWFFEIYIQGSKYNFLELSLNLNKAPIFGSGRRVSVIKDLWSREGPEQIDQATKST